MSHRQSGSVSLSETVTEYDFDWMPTEPTPIEGDWFQPGIFDISMPIHPTYKKWLNPSLKVGDLVETYNSEIGVIVQVSEPEGIALRISEANNNTYAVLIGDKEKTYVGYSLIKIKK